MKNENFSVKLVAAMAMLSAISIIMGKYLQIPIGDTLRFSFENLPIIFTGLAFGPICGMLVGAVADLIGCLLVGYAINPIVTIGAIMCGGVSGTAYMLLKNVKMPRTLKCIITVSSAHFIASVLIKTFGLAKFYDMPLGILMLWRLLNYVIIGVLECLLLCVLLRNKSVINAINSLMRTSKALSKVTESNGDKTMAKASNDKFIGYANSFQAVTVPGLERIGELCAMLGNPQEALKFVHIAGTNGKGSVCANLSCILEDAGVKVGKYISPNLIKVNERISVNGTDISDEALSRLLEKIEPLCAKAEDKLGIAPTQFEIWTALAFEYFREQECDIVVLEVGLGGEFDATNIISKNELAVITRLGLDHTQYLGNTLAEVASAKCGIMKKNCAMGTVITVNQDAEAMQVIEEHAAELSHTVKVPMPELCEGEGVFESFMLDGKEYTCGIAGLHQVENASLAIYAARSLGISEDAIASGVKRARNPARFELLESNPPILYDGGHNENGIEALNKSLDRYFKGEQKTVIFACMEDKEIKESLKMLSIGNTEFIFTTVKNNPRAMSAAALCERAKSYGFNGSAFEEIGDAYEEAKRRGRLTVICGSLYLYKDLREYLDK